MNARMKQNSQANISQSSHITRWHFVRHAPVPHSASLLYATHDEPADCSNTSAFAALAMMLPARAQLLTSGLKRTEATADAIIAAGWLAGSRAIDPRLAEQHYGQWHGHSQTELRAELTDRPRHKHWFTTAADQPPGGESFITVAARVKEVMLVQTESHAGQTIVAVAHGGTIRAALALALGIDLDRALTISVHNLSVTRIDHVPGPGLGGDWRVVYTNRRPE
jgi:broad specificity phosphatase PhoE